jgi:hypothetical protein
MRSPMPSSRTPLPESCELAPGCSGMILAHATSEV